MEKANYRLFVDIDGTLAVFTPVNELETLYTKGYFANLLPHEKVVAAIKEINDNVSDVEVFILSSYLTDSDYALKEKNDWLDRFLPEVNRENRIFVPYGDDKKEHIQGGITKNDFLLDDFSHNLILWEKGAGRGIKLLNGINHTRGSWQGDRIDFSKPAISLATNIIEVVRGEQRYFDKPPARVPMPLQIKDEVVSVLSGQTNCELIAFDNEGKMAGYIQYALYEDKPHIQLISTEEPYKRKGVATRLLQELQKLYAGQEIMWGMLTEDGAKLKEATTYVVEDKEVSTLMERLEVVKASIRENESQLDTLCSIENLTEEQTNTLVQLSDKWGLLSDEETALVSEIDGRPTTKIFIKIEPVEREGNIMADTNKFIPIEEIATLDFIRNPELRGVNGMTYETEMYQNAVLGASGEQLASLKARYELALDKAALAGTFEPKIAILQLREGAENRNRRFAGMSTLADFEKESPNCDNYEIIYIRNGEKNLTAPEMEAMNDLVYNEFNADKLRPRNYYGHSLSVGDVIVHSSKSDTAQVLTAYFVDSVGMTKLPDDFLNRSTIARIDNNLDIQNEVTLAERVIRYEAESIVQLNDKAFTDRQFQITGNYLPIFEMADARGAIADLDALGFVPSPRQGADNNTLLFQEKGDETKTFTINGLENVQSFIAKTNDLKDFYSLEVLQARVNGDYSVIGVDVADDRMVQAAINTFPTSDYRRMVQAVYNYETKNNIPEFDRMTKMFTNQGADVSVSKPWYRENDVSVMDKAVSDRYIAITENAITTRYAEILQDRQGGQVLEPQTVISDKTDNIKVAGHTGTWYVIDSETIDDKKLFLVESEQYGDEAAAIIIDEQGDLVLDEVYNGFDDYREAFPPVSVQQFMARINLEETIVKEWQEKNGMILPDREQGMIHDITTDVDGVKDLLALEDMIYQIIEDYEETQVQERGDNVDVEQEKQPLEVGDIFSHEGKQYKVSTYDGFMLSAENLDKNDTQTSIAWIGGVESYEYTIIAKAGQEMPTLEVITNEKNRRVLDILSINTNNITPNSLVTELTARETAKIDIAINHLYRDYTNDELREAVTFMENYEPIPNHYYEPDLDLDGTADTLYDQVRYIENPDALHRLAEILTQEGKTEQAERVGYVEELAREEPAVFSLAQMKLDFMDELYSGVDEVAIADDTTLSVMYEKRDGNVIVAVSQNWQDGSDDVSSMGVTAIPLQDFKNLSPAEFNVVIGEVLAYQMNEQERTPNEERMQELNHGDNEKEPSIQVLFRDEASGVEAGINADGNLFFGNDVGGGNLPDTPENRSRVEREIERTTGKNFSFEVGAETKDIDGHNCIVVDEWKDGVTSFVLGQSTDNTDFYFAQIDETDGNFRGVYTYEHNGDKPTRKAVEREHLNKLSLIDNDRHEAEYGANGNLAVNHGDYTVEKPHVSFIPVEIDADLPPKDQLKQRLENGVRQVLDSENFKNWLSTGGKLFYNNYSFRNAMLVWLQKPDASHVMGYEKWKEFGRNVAQGASGAKIFIPLMASEKFKGGLLKSIKYNLNEQLSKDPSISNASYRLGTSNFEFTMNRANHLVGFKVNGVEQQIFGSDEEARRFIDRAIIGKVPTGFTVGTVFDAKDVIAPEYLWVKTGYTKDEVAPDEKGNPMKNRRGEVRIFNTVERQARFQPDLEKTIVAGDLIKMQSLFDACVAASERKGVPVTLVPTAEDKHLEGGALGYYTREIAENAPNGSIVIRDELSITDKCSVLLHEMGHADLHKNLDALAISMGEKKVTKEMREIQAEAVSFATAQTFGIETGTNSFQYLAVYTKGFEMQDFEKSLDVIYKESKALLNDIKTELDMRGLNLDLSDKPKQPLDKETLVALSTKYIDIATEKGNDMQAGFNELPSLIKESANEPSLIEILRYQKENLVARQEHLDVMLNSVDALNSATTREGQDDAISTLESAAQRVTGSEFAFEVLTERFIDTMEHIKGGLKLDYDKDPRLTLDTMKKDFSALSKLSAPQLEYIATSKYISREFSKLLRSDPQEFVDRVTARADLISKVAAKNGTFVEVNYCEQWTDKPFIKNGTLCSPKIADKIITSCEAQTRGLKLEAEKLGDYFPYTKCDITVFTPDKDGKLLSYVSRVDIGDGSQVSLKDHLEQSLQHGSTDKTTVLENFSDALSERADKRKIIAQDFSGKVAESETPEAQPDKDSNFTQEQWGEKIKDAREQAEQEQKEQVAERPQEKADKGRTD